MGTGPGELRTEQSCGVRGKSEEQGEGTAGGWHVAARWVGAQGWVQSHKLLLSGWPWRQLPRRSSCSEPPTPTRLWRSRRAARVRVGKGQGGEAAS